MDLSNLHSSLREVGEGLDESTSRRRANHLRSAEEDLNAHFRSSALQLTTLYRQAVSSSKASYEKGYAHALAHVLELCDADRNWLKGYLQRRIEAIEAEQHDDDAEEVGEQMDAEPHQTTEQDPDESLQRQEEQRQRSTHPSPRKPTTQTPQHPAATKGVSSLKSGSKRTRPSSSSSALSHLPSQQQQQEPGYL